MKKEIENHMYEVQDILAQSGYILQNWVGKDGVMQNQVIDDIDGKPIIVQFVCLANLLAAQKYVSKDLSEALLEEAANITVGYTLGKLSDDHIRDFMIPLCDRLELEFV